MHIFIFLSWLIYLSKLFVKCNKEYKAQEENNLPQWNLLVFRNFNHHFRVRSVARLIAGLGYVCYVLFRNVGFNIYQFIQIVIFNVNLIVVFVSCLFDTGWRVVAFNSRFIFYLGYFWNMFFDCGADMGLSNSITLVWILYVLNVHGNRGYWLRVGSLDSWGWGWAVLSGGVGRNVGRPSQVCHTHVRHTRLVALVQFLFCWH